MRVWYLVVEGKTIRFVRWEKRINLITNLRKINFRDNDSGLLLMNMATGAVLSTREETKE
jgi:hypothetical protein